MEKERERERGKERLRQKKERGRQRNRERKSERKRESGSKGEWHIKTIGDKNYNYDFIRAKKTGGNKKVFLTFMLIITTTLSAVFTSVNPI